MKIIKEGNPEFAKQPVTFACDVCDCIFEADNTEYSSWGTRGPIRTSSGIKYLSYFECACPCCGNMIRIER